MLKWQYELDNATEHNTVSETAKTIIRKIDVSQIPDNFMGNVTLQRDINNTHIDITNSYSEFCNSIITEMEKLLPVKYVTVNTNTQKKRYNRYKLWWTEKLTELWDVRCAAERGMSGGTNDRQIFIEHQRNFDQEVRSAKRHYWYQQQQELLETRLSTDFWKTMGRIGISQSHTHSIPWEVVNDDQSIISDQNVVLNK